MTEAKDLEVAVREVIAEVSRGTVSMADLLSALAPEREEHLPVPANISPPIKLTEAEEEALDKAAKVYGSVVPNERRRLESSEISQLIEEKMTLDQLKKMAEKRQDSFRTIIFNHLDVEAEEKGLVEDADFDKRGHYVLPGEARGEPGDEKIFVRQVRQSGPALDVGALEDLVNDPEVEFSHEDWLAMTKQTRVVDEAKVMQALKKNPNLVHAISKAVRPGNKTAALVPGKP